MSEEYVEEVIAQEQEVVTESAPEVITELNEQVVRLTIEAIDHATESSTQTDATPPNDPNDLTLPIENAIHPTNMITNINMMQVPVSIAICAISYRGAPYMYEWIRYHFCLGIDQVYIYNYDDTPPYPNSYSITVSPCKAVGKEFDVYPHFIEHFGKRHTWVAFMDINEFIVLKNHPSIHPFLSDYRGCSAIGLNRVTFGTNDLVENTEEPVTKRFIRCAEKPDNFIRSIVRIDHFENVINKHHVKLKAGHTYNTRYQIIDRDIQPNGPTDVACIHHYYTKSESEMRLLIEDGWEIPSFPLDRIHSQFNEIYNTDAWDFYSSRL
jgi:hypothetical protein